MINAMLRIYNKMLISFVERKFFVSSIGIATSTAIQLIFFVLFGVWKMVFVSVACVLFSFRIVKAAANDEKNISSYIITHSLIIFYVCYAVISTGWQNGFQQYLIAYLPVGLYIGWSIFDKKYKFLTYVFHVIDFLTYCILYFASNKIKPYYVLTSEQANTFFLITSIGMFVSILYYCCIFKIETKRAEVKLLMKNNALIADAQKDPLTGLLNRRGFMPLIQDCIKNDKQFSVAICDIDNFKRVNDTYGHDAGDEILRTVSKIITEETFGNKVCRWGGEEIVVLFENMTIAAATHLMENARESVEKYVTNFADKQIKVTITVGVEQQRQAYHSDIDAITVADSRLYYGKNHGKNVVVNQDYKEECDR